MIPPHRHGSQVNFWIQIRAALILENFWNTVNSNVKGDHFWSRSRNDVSPPPPSLPPPPPPARKSNSLRKNITYDSHNRYRAYMNRTVKKQCSRTSVIRHVARFNEPPFYQTLSCKLDSYDRCWCFRRAQLKQAHRLKMHVRRWPRFETRFTPNENGGEP